MESLKEFIKKHKANTEKAKDFLDYLYELMDKHGFDKNSDLYNKANISRQLWSSVISKKSEPSLNFTLKLVFTLHLNNHECKYLLKKAGFTLASSSDFALVIRYCIENKIYDIQKVNDYLEERNLEIIE